MSEAAGRARSFAVVTDSTADLPAGQFERLQIHQVPLTVNWDGQSYRDKIDLTTAELYARLGQSRSLPSTAAPALGDFEQLYRALLQRHEAVLAVHVGATFSSTWSASSTAAQAVDSARIRVLDSGTTTMCLGWATAEAARLADAGEPMPVAAAAIEALIPRLRLYAAVDTLEFLERGGRIGRVQALAGTLLRVKPLIQVQQGQVLPLERVRTRGAAVRRLAELAAGLPAVERLGVLHGAAPDTARELIAALEQRYPELEIEVGEIGVVIGTHAGPGVFGFTAVLGQA
jgi:DegV family protein with EDD domain